jgi:adenine nucleotide transporter 17
MYHILCSFGLQGIYYYFYQLLKNKVENLAAARGKKGLGDGTVGMFSWLVIAAIAG